MEIVPIWKDAYFEYAGNSVEYRISHGGTEIFHGMAVKSPVESTIRIKLNDICSAYLNSLLLPENVLRATEVDSMELMQSYGEFLVETYNRSTSEWDIAEEIAFVNDYSYEDRNMTEGLMSDPINGHSAAGQILPCTYFTIAGYTFCFNSSSIFFTITSGQAVQKTSAGGTWEIDYDTNLESAYYSFNNGASTGYTSGGQLSLSLPSNTSYFSDEYEVIFYTAPGGIRLSSAVATVTAEQEPSSGSTPDTPIGYTFEFITADGVAISSSATAYTVSWNTNYPSIRYTYNGNSYTTSDNYATLTFPANTNSGTTVTRSITCYTTGGTSLGTRTWIQQEAEPSYYFNFTSQGGNISSGGTTQRINWNTNYPSIYYELLDSGDTVYQSGTTAGQYADITFPANGMAVERGYDLNARTEQGGTLLGTLHFTQAASDGGSDTGDTGDYESQYLTLEIISGGTLVWSGGTGVNLEYSTDSGATWETLWRNTSGITVESGDTVLLRAEAQSHRNLHLIKSTATFNVYGNIMSLLYGDNFLGQTELPAAGGTFYQLFLSTRVKSARHLVLPATTLAAACYDSMFRGCSLLTDAPALPATTLADSCYIEMFEGCFSLGTAPTLPATTLAGICYYGMFASCYSLTTAPALPATTLADGCYSNMFIYCSSLTTAPDLPATTLTDYCYNAMFKDCSSLNYVKCLATSFGIRSTADWLSGVNSTGTFIQDASATWSSGASGIPSGWTVQNA